MRAKHQKISLALMQIIIPQNGAIGLINPGTTVPKQVTEKTIQKIQKNKDVTSPDYSRKSLLTAI